MNGFDRNKPAQFYIHKVYCHELNLEFIKYGITNNEPQKRIKSQMYNSNRDSDYKFESELLYESKIMDGTFVFDTEFNIKTELTKYAKIPKSLFSDN